MSFIADIVEAVIDIVVAVVEIIVQIVEVIIEFIMTLLGFNETEQIIEYFEVHNVPFFEHVDDMNPLKEVVKRAVLQPSDLAGELIYAATFRSYKGDIQKFMNYIDDGNYIEGFPTIESYITYPDYDEITAVLLILNGVPCTPEHSYTRALIIPDWVKYWLQENKGYSYENNELGHSVTASSSPISPASSAVLTTGSPNILLTITDEIAVYDEVEATTIWQVDFGDITYNPGTDDYTIGIYNSQGDTDVLPYTVPSKPTGLHYVSYYYIDSAPTVRYIFVYKVGEGTYPDLDNPQNEINLDATALHAIPAIPLRLSNVDYTDRPAGEVVKIEELCELVSLDAPGILDAIKNDPDAPTADDLDHIYVNFGIRMRDTSQVGLAYLFNFCENLFPAQGVTKGIYESSPVGDTKPANNIIITAGDYKSLFQFSYLSYEFTTLAEIDADSGSPENGFYYSDMSRFNDAGILAYTYYVSSSKGTYNVGYKADTLDEVQDFLDGNGVVNPGDTTTEAANWLQVTTRMSYNNPAPVLQDADGTVSDLVYLTPDLVYRNNGAGVLRHVEAATEATTSGQSITYYRAIPSGLEAYTMAAPIASLRVVDGDTGKFKMVKFNLGAPDDLMAPFVHNFIANLSNKDVTQLFLAGSHASIYVAHYEVIVQRTGGFGGLFAILIIIIIVVVAAYVAPAFFGAGAGAGGSGGLLSAMGVVTVAEGAAAGSILWGATFMNLIVKFAVNQIIKFAVTAVFGEDSMIGSLVGMVLGAVAVSGVGFGESGFYTDFGGITDFDFDAFTRDWAWTDTVKVLAAGMEIGGSVLENTAKEKFGDLQAEGEAFEAYSAERLLDLNGKETRLRELHESLFATAKDSKSTYSALIDVQHSIHSPMLLAENVYAYHDNYTAIIEADYEQTSFLDQKIYAQAGFDS